jgi:hypothetical protein
MISFHGVLQAEEEPQAEDGEHQLFQTKHKREKRSFTPPTLN